MNFQAICADVASPNSQLCLYVISMHPKVLHIHNSNDVISHYSIIFLILRIAHLK